MELFGDDVEATVAGLVSGGVDGGGLGFEAFPALAGPAKLLASAKIPATL